MTDFESQLPKLDLRAVCCDADKMETVVSVYDNNYSRVEWLRLGRVESTPPNTNLDCWRFKAPLGFEATDSSHSSVLVVSLMLTGVSLGLLHSGRTCLDARIVGDDVDVFRVPESSDYYTRVLVRDAVMCRECTPSHPIVEHFAPKPNVALYNLLRGRRVEIRYFAPRTKTP